MTEPNEPVQIEIEDENETKDESIKPSEVSQSRPTEGLNAVKIARKKVDELTEQERSQLITDAQNGKENEFYSVKLFKNGKTKISLKKQSKAQQLIQSNEANVEKISLPSSRYLTDNQLLFEHIINLETQYSKLSQKHKKLKKRYNDLEGYLYADDSDDEKPAAHGSVSAQEPKPQQKQIQPEPQLQPQPIQQERRSVPASQPYVQHRYLKSWRDLRPQ